MAISIDASQYFSKGKKLKAPKKCSLIFQYYSDWDQESLSLGRSIQAIDCPVDQGLLLGGQ